MINLRNKTDKMREFASMSCNNDCATKDLLVTVKIQKDGIVEPDETHWLYDEKKERQNICVPSDNKEKGFAASSMQSTVIIVIVVVVVVLALALALVCVWRRRGRGGEGGGEGGGHTIILAHFFV